MAKSKLKKWAERHAMLIALRFALTIFYPMAFIGLAMAALAGLILLIALLRYAPPVV